MEVSHPSILKRFVVNSHDFLTAKEALYANINGEYLLKCAKVQHFLG